MSLISILIVLIIVGVGLWLINTYIPMDRKIKTILNVVVVILVILWLLNAFGVLDSNSTMHMGRLHVR
ncbi:MAG TPA: Thivi_2564 family membrane protein [Chitinivibrionales bacterium]